VRRKRFYLLAIGLAFFAGGTVCGVFAIGQAETASAYSHAAACPGSAAFDADCVQTVGGSVTGVEEFSGKDSHYELDVQAGSDALAITFPRPPHAVEQVLAHTVADDGEEPGSATGRVALAGDARPARLGIRLRQVDDGDIALGHGGLG
jgi:hypothetical protein